MKITYRINDTWIQVEAEGTDHRALWHRCLNALAATGFVITRDPRIHRDYRILSPHHRYGRHGHCEFDTEINNHGRPLFRFEFYQNVVTEHKAGGKYDYGKLARMPYLARLRFLHARRTLVLLLRSEGAEDVSGFPVPGMSAIDRIRLDKRNCFHCKVDPITEWQPADGVHYNWRDRDGNRLRPGEERCFYHRGRLMRGRVYYSLNSMWFAACNNLLLTLSASEFFAWRPGTPRRRPLRLEERHRKVKDCLDRCVKRMDFERAIGCRDWMRLNPLPEKEAA